MHRINFPLFAGLSILILLVGAAWIWISIPPAGSTTQGEIQAPQRGFTAPNFTLDTPGSDSFTLSELRGRPVLINFWASWCPPCRSEMPAMQRVYDDLQEQGFTVLAVNSTHQDDLDSALTFAENLGLTFPILLDRDGSVGTLYGIRSLPTSFFIDPDGTIQDVVIGGPMSEALLRIRVEQLLGGNP